MNIQWYPGHMAKTKRQMEESIRLVDAVVEVVDARIPFSGKNPYLNELWGKRPRVLVLNKADLADPAKTAKWKAYYEALGYGVVTVDALHKKGIRDIPAKVAEVCSEKLKQRAAKGINKPLRMMVTGIPNVGKSTVINQLVGKSGAAKTGDKPGVTKSEQWLKVNWNASQNLELLDTPGILWPKFDDPEVGTRIAFIGSISDDILNEYTLASELIVFLEKTYPGALSARYNLTEEERAAVPEQILEHIGRHRGHLRSGGVVDVERTATMLLDEFRGGKIGRFTLEEPSEVQNGGEN